MVSLAPGQLAKALHRLNCIRSGSGPDLRPLCNNDARLASQDQFLVHETGHRAGDHLVRKTRPGEWRESSYFKLVPCLIELGTVSLAS